MVETTTPRRRRRRGGSRALSALGALLILAGGVVLGGFLLAPDATEQVSERVVGSVRQSVQSFDQSTPSVQLGGPGDIAELDAARDEFIEMVAYERAGLQPTYAAHNGYGGDVVLYWEMGQEVDVVYPDGTTVPMRVTDARDVPKVGSTTSEITGLAGSILLQSCYWGDPDMRFVALTPVGEDAVVPEQGPGDAPLWDGS